MEARCLVLIGKSIDKTIVHLLIFSLIVNFGWLVNGQKW